MSEPVTLLYIDDDQSIIRLVGTFFKNSGYRVILASDGEAGIKEFRLQKPDIVLVDLRMPKVDGFQVLEVITKESPETPVIVVSGEGDMEDVIQALRLGAWNYHTKPIENFTIFQHAITQALEKSRLIKENNAYQKGLETKLGTIVENLTCFIATCTPDCIITYMNQAFIKHVGRDAVGETFHDFFLGPKSKCPCCQKDLPMHGETSKQDIQNQKDGRWYHTLCSPIYDQSDKIVEWQLILHDITDHKKTEADFEEREEYLRKENMRLRASLTDRYKFHNIIGRSKPMQSVYESIINASASDASVIIYGESGTGKELVAKAVHENSDRKEKQLVYVNCGAIPETLIESEFFGYKKGAFTGANKDKHGFLEIADGSTLFLDEVGEIPLSMQIKLLRAIEGNGYSAIGSTELKKPDIRIIAATNKDLKEEVRAGKIREDFLYRIHIIPIHLPPLRERKEDIPLLIDHFLSKYDKDEIPPLPARISQALNEYNWPGNVRELQNTLHRFFTLKKLDFMNMDLSDQTDESIDLPPDQQDLPLNVMLDRIEEKILRQAFEKNDFHRGKTAEALHIDRKTLYRKMKQHSITISPIK